MARCSHRLLALFTGFMAMLLVPSVARSYDIPNQVLQSFTFDLHSIDDEVDLYAGDPQRLFRLYLRPQATLPPNIEFSNSGQAGLLRVRDLSLFEEPPLPIDEFAEDEDLAMEEPKRHVVAQEWRLELAPSTPASMVLQCERGKARYDFTGIDVREVHLLADTAQIRVDFDRPNRVTLERCKITCNGGSLRLRRFLNARARSTTLSVDQVRCEIEVTGELFSGAVELFVEGVAKEMKLTLRRDIALQVMGPASNVVRFDRNDFERVGTGLQTPHFVDQPCRLTLHFSQVIPRLRVEWID